MRAFVPSLLLCILRLKFIRRKTLHSLQLPRHLFIRACWITSGLYLSTSRKQRKDSALFELELQDAKWYIAINFYKQLDAELETLYWEGSGQKYAFFCKVLRNVALCILLHDFLAFFWCMSKREALKALPQVHDSRIVAISILTPA